MYVVEKEIESKEELRESYQIALAGLKHAQDTLEREIQISQQVSALQLEEVNLGSKVESRSVQIAMEVEPTIKTTIIELLREYKDVFAWSFVLRKEDESG